MFPLSVWTESRSLSLYPHNSELLPRRHVVGLGVVTEKFRKDLVPPCLPLSIESGRTDVGWTL